MLLSFTHNLYLITLANQPVTKLNMLITQIENAFIYHAPKNEAMVETYQSIRNTGLDLAKIIHEKCPDTPETEIAINKVREAVMWANASIACNT